MGACSIWGVPQYSMCPRDMGCAPTACPMWPSCKSGVRGTHSRKQPNTRGARDTTKRTRPRSMPARVRHRYNRVGMLRAQHTVSLQQPHSSRESSNARVGTKWMNVLVKTILQESKPGFFVLSEFAIHFVPRTFVGFVLNSSLHKQTHRWREHEWNRELNVETRHQNFRHKSQTKRHLCCWPHSVVQVFFQVSTCQALIQLKSRRLFWKRPRRIILWQSRCLWCAIHDSPHQQHSTLWFVFPNVVKQDKRTLPTTSQEDSFTRWYCKQKTNKKCTSFWLLWQTPPHPSSLGFWNYRQYLQTFCFFTRANQDVFTLPTDCVTWQDKTSRSADSIGYSKYNAMQQSELYSTLWDIAPFHVTESHWKTLILDACALSYTLCARSFTILYVQVTDIHDMYICVHAVYSTTYIHAHEKTHNKHQNRKIVATFLNRYHNVCLK